MRPERESFICFASFSWVDSSDVEIDVPQVVRHRQPYVEMLHSFAEYRQAWQVQRVELSIELIDHRAYLDVSAVVFLHVEVCYEPSHLAVFMWKRRAYHHVPELIRSC